MRTKYSNKNRINVVTLGCSKNIYDSEVLMGQLKANNKDVVHEQEGNIVVINTCGFIDNAKQESIDTILDYSSKKQNGLIDKLLDQILLKITCNDVLASMVFAFASF